MKKIVFIYVLTLLISNFAQAANIKISDNLLPQLGKRDTITIKFKDGSSAVLSKTNTEYNAPREQYMIEAVLMYEYTGDVDLKANDLEVKEDFTLYQIDCIVRNWIRESKKNTQRLFDLNILAIVKKDTNYIMKKVSQTLFTRTMSVLIAPGDSWHISIKGNLNAQPTPDIDYYCELN